ncbi:DJ-1/PfpI family protein [Carnobacterium maltaromaticum]|uniref:type 1 glutamine amidotransferase domain-containing protein n=1 Tax=Carnobacterium maltaromaticum TaxID=2751 RepID=UPI00191B8F9F|nr:type 1 glutamine amidotransferase domain-containing protein [Carnobacterium maltaromaticum]CAD5902076.1 DJ-1/PfpI family protein [Carnobacterium maltaromaticum]
MILIPIPKEDFDPTEVSIPWKILKIQGYDVRFATPDGSISKGDHRMVYGTNLGIFKSILMARKDAVLAYKELIESEEFNNPISYSKIQFNDYKGLILPGGHAPGMKTYLESKVLQNKVVDFFINELPVGAICHGTVVLARTINPDTGYSVIKKHQTTGLLKKQELGAYLLTKLWLKNYYRTYPITVEDEVKQALSNPKNFKKGNSGLFRDSPQRKKHGFVVQSGHYISARWPGDVYQFTDVFINLINKNT